MDLVLGEAALAAKALTDANETAGKAGLAALAASVGENPDIEWAIVWHHKTDFEHTTFAGTFHIALDYQNGTFVPNWADMAYRAYDAEAFVPLTEAQAEKLFPELTSLIDQQNKHLEAGLNVLREFREVSFEDLCEKAPNLTQVAHAQAVLRTNAREVAYQTASGPIEGALADEFQRVCLDATLHHPSHGPIHFKAYPHYQRGSDIPTRIDVEPQHAVPAQVSPDLEQAAKEAIVANKALFHRFEFANVVMLNDGWKKWVEEYINVSDAIGADLDEIAQERINFKERQLASSSSRTR